MNFLPLYQSHKTVRAARIVAVDVSTNTLTVEVDGVARAIAPQLGFFRRSVPAVGDYFIQYRDGYQSHCPASEFLDGHKLAGQPDGQMDFGGALNALRAGKRVARSGWNGKGMWLALSCDGSRQVPAEGFWSPHNAAFARENGGSATVLPSITMKTATGEILMGWLASQTDMLATDWVVVE